MHATPRPWVVDDGTDSIDNMADCLRTDKGTEREWVAVGICDGDGYAESVAYCHPDNAALIVHAVNTFDEAKAALEATIKAIRRNSQQLLYHDVLQAMEAVLARMGG